MRLPDSFKLLIVEDNQGDMVLLKRAFNLTGLNFQIRWESDGQTALAAVQTMAASDLIVIDLHLPKISGWAVLDMVRATSRSHVAVLSSSESPSDIKRAKERSCLYIQKPMLVTEYGHIVRQLLELLDSA